MGAIASVLGGPLLKVGGIILLIVGLVGIGYALYLKYDDMAESVTIAQQNEATANANAVTATNAAQTNALFAVQTQRQGEEVAATLTAQKNAAVKRATTLQGALTEIQNEPHTSACTSSAVVSDTLDRLRSAQAARAALGGAGPASTTDAGS